jgi:hypothetical protein
MRNAYRILIGKPEGTEDRSALLKWIMEKWGLRMWSAFTWLRTGTCDRLVNAVLDLRVT